jgi:RNA polymerase sigma-70 factor (ECF subfamily)
MADGSGRRRKGEASEPGPAMVSIALSPPSLAAMTRSADESGLLARARAGDQAAFRDLVERHADRIFRLVRSYVRDLAEAEDVVQEVFFKVHGKLHGFREDSAFSTWLYRVAINAAHDHRKKRRRRDETVADPGLTLGLADPRGGPAEDLARTSLREEVRAAIMTLPGIFRDVIVLREIEGLAYDDIARVLGLAMGTVESRLFRARERLREELQRRGLGPLPEPEE